MSPYGPFVPGVVRGMRVNVLAGRDACYRYGESVNMKKDFPKAKATIREGKQVAPSGLDDGAQKKNKFYALQSREYQG